MPTTFAKVPIEEVRAYWDARPCNIRHSRQEVGTREYFDEVEARKYFVEPHIPGFAQFDRWAGKRVLEIGCGIGTDTINFARAGATVTAVDVSPRSIEIAQARAVTYGLQDRITFVSGNAEALPELIGPAEFDLIYSFGVIHHTPHVEQVVAHISRYLAPGGTVKLMVYHRRSWKVLGIFLRSGRGRFWKLDALIARASEAQTGCPVTYSYTRRTIRELLEANGLHVVACEVEHIFPWRIADYVEYRYVKAWPFRWLPDWHLCVTATR